MPNLQMAAILTTSAQIVVKIVAIRKRRPREAPSRAALFAKRQSRAALEAEAGILQGGDGRLEITVTSAFAPSSGHGLAVRAEAALLVSNRAPLVQICRNLCQHLADCFLWARLPDLSSR